MENFWKKFQPEADPPWAEKKPIFCLAPMADVTDCAFRQIIAKYGKPDIFFTEFVSADGLAHKEAREKLLVDLKYSESEHPIVAQIFGGKPENIKITSALCRELGFDGIDINMGCPDKSIEKQCAGAAMMKDFKLTKEIIRAAREGGGGLPISVKTRIGYNPPGGYASRAGKNEMESWVKTLLSEDLAALIIHLRTRKEMSDVPAHWDLAKRIVEIRNGMNVKTLIIGNGDVMNIDEAKRKCKETGCDGVMLGRAIFGNPWLFSTSFNIFSLRTAKRNSSLENTERSFIAEKLKVMLEHTKLFEEMLMHSARGGPALGGKNFAIMKKHFKAYVSGWDGAKELRIKLMETKNASEVEKILDNFLK